MAASELSLLFWKIAKQAKLCNCAKITRKNNSHDHQSEEHDINICPQCKAPISVVENDIVSQMGNAVYKALQDIGIDLNKMSSKNVNEGGSENIHYIINCELKYLKKNSKGETLLHSAARKKDLQSIKNMLNLNVNPNTQDNAGWTPLHEAVFSDNLDIASELLIAGAIVNVPGYEFTTPLHVAVDHDNLEMVKLLLKFGANPNLRDLNGQYPENLVKSPTVLSVLKEYSEQSDMIEMSKHFQKKVAPRTMNIFLCGELLSVNEQCSLESNLKIKFSKNLNKDVTHIVVDHLENNVCEPKFEVMKGMLMGCVVVNVKWLKFCLLRNELVSFNDYEINGTTNFPSINGPKRSRNNFLEMNPPLFMGCNIFLKVKNDLSVLKDLVTCSGAKLLNREPNPEHSPTSNFLFHCEPGHAMESTSTLILYETGSHEPTLKYNMKHIKSVSVQWFFDCIQTFTIRDF